MAIYHLEAKVISRGVGRSAVAASAYISCSKMMNDYDGVSHDYTRKQGLVWEQVFLPPQAPAAWADRELLWNAVEAAEKTKDSRLAREFVAALPVELDKEQWKTLLTEFIKTQFVAEGMCADVAVHDTDGHNPHAHILLTVRPLDEQGRWQKKTEKEYLCYRNGQEQGFTAAEFPLALAQGWEKLYLYLVDGKKQYLPSSTAQYFGFERLSKYPKSTRYGRQNPISERWNIEEQLGLWREAWAKEVNQALRKAEREERVDHRSHAARGIEDQPTIHEGAAARTMEKQGRVSERCEINRQIRRDNALLRSLRAQYEKLQDSVAATIKALAGALETLRGNLLVLLYQRSHLSSRIQRQEQSLASAKGALARYTELGGQIRGLAKDRKALVAEKENTPALRTPKHRELSRRISELTENIEDLKSERTILTQGVTDTGDPVNQVLKQRVQTLEKGLESLSASEKRNGEEQEKTLTAYKEQKTKADKFDPVEMYAARQKLRPQAEQEVRQRIQKTHGKVSLLTMMDSERKLTSLLNESTDETSFWEKQRSLHRAEKTKLQKKTKYEKPPVR